MFAERRQQIQEMSTIDQVDDSRLFNDGQFLQLCINDENDPCTPSMNADKHLTTKQRHVDNINGSTNKNTSTTGDVMNEAFARPGDSPAIPNVPEELQNSTEEAFAEFVDGIKVDRNAPWIDSVYGTQRRVVEINSSGMMHQQRIHGEGDYILTQIDGRTGELYVHMAGHCYPIGIGGEAETSKPDRQRMPSNPPACQSSCLAYGDTGGKGAGATHRQHSNSITYDTSEIPRDCHQYRYDVEQTSPSLYIEDEPPDCLIEDNGNGRKGKTRQIKSPLNDGPNTGLTTTERGNGEKWYYDLRQYSDGVTRLAFDPFYCIPKGKTNNCKMELDCVQEVDTGQHYISLPPVTEVLPKISDMYYDSDTTVFRYDGEINTSNLERNCSNLERNLSLETSMMQQGEVEPANAAHGQFVTYRKELNKQPKEILPSESSSCFPEHQSAKQYSPSTAMRREPLSAERKRQMKKMKRGCRLWEFIRNLLLDPATNPSLIRWENRNKGTFRLVQSKAIAYKWGMKKGNEGMTYEKLSRAMRYYYKRQVFQPVLGKRLVYSFGPRATGWRDDKSPKPST